MIKDFIVFAYPEVPWDDTTTKTRICICYGN